MHTVKIAGSDLNYFKEIVGAALRGSYGSVDEVTLDVHEDGRISLSLNEIASSRFGTPSGPLESSGPDVSTARQHAETVAAELQRTREVAEGSGNPYAQLSQEDGGEDSRIVVPNSGNQDSNGKPLKNKDRILLLEGEVQRLWGVVSNAEEQLGVRLIPTQG
jgi:hypothetical protein